MVNEAQAPPAWRSGRFRSGPVIVMAAIPLGIVLAVVGSHSRFLATDLGGVFVTITALILALLVGGLTWRGLRGNGGQGRGKLFLASAILSFSTFMIAVGDLTLLSSWYTDLVGVRGSMEVTVIGQASGGRYGCHRLEIAEQGWIGGDRAFCTSPEQASRIPIGQKITVSGPISALGLDADPIDLTRYEARR